MVLRIGHGIMVLFPRDRGYFLVLDVSDYDSSITQQTFSLDCNGASGDVIYITDEDVGDNKGHGISEVKVHKSCKKRSAFAVEYLALAKNRPIYTISGSVI